MIERTPSPHRMTAARIGRTDLGAATVVFEDDALVVILGAADDHPVRIPFASIDALHDDAAVLELRLLDGTQIRLAAESAATFRHEIVLRCCTIPELTRTLRAFGSRRGSRGVRVSAAAEQQRFFAPLLGARRTADSAKTPLSALDAFDATRLAADVDATLAAFAAARFGSNAPARRALHAELFDAGEPLRLALIELARLADHARAASGDLRAWRAWSDQLRAVFETADRTWLALDAALEASLEAALDRGVMPR